MRPHRVLVRPSRSAGLLLLLLLVGCGGGNVLNPQFQPQISNQTDNFQFQATGVTNVSQTLQYTWQNTGTMADVNQACSITGGMATLSIRDAAGTMVYSRDLSANGTFQTTPVGTTGAWRIEVFLSSLTGTLNFRVQKRP